MSLTKLIKLNARRAMRNNWGRAVAIVLLTLAIALMFTFFEGILTTTLGIPAFVDITGTPDNFLDDISNTSILSVSILLFTSLLYLLVLTPLGLGRTGWFYRIGEGKSDEVASVFEFFGAAGPFFKSLWLMVNISVRSALWTFLFTLPGTALIGLAVYSSRAMETNDEKLILVAALSAGLVLSFVGALLSLIWCFRYYLSRYLIVGDRSLSVRSAIKRSIAGTKGEKGSILFFELSFLGWRMLGLLVIPMLYTVPYFETSRGLYARYLIESRRLSAASSQKSRFQTGMGETGFDGQQAFGDKI